VAAQRSGKAAPDVPRYLHTAEVADILHVSPKTVSRWAKEGKLPFLKTLGGHRRYPAAEIRQLADELQVRPTAWAFSSLRLALKDRQRQSHHAPTTNGRVSAGYFVDCWLAG
jgi:excisionase family DNA binding protein